MKLEGKKLLILGANQETAMLVKVAKEMGVITLVTDNNPCAFAKSYADQSFDVDGMDVPGLIALAKQEQVDGVLVGVADALVEPYFKVCEVLNLPCYATPEASTVLTQKDRFKALCEAHGVHGVPEYFLDESMKDEDIDCLEFPVMVKPMDSSSGRGITLCRDRNELQKAVARALAASRSKRFMVEKYMKCSDVGIYYTFVDGQCSVSCVYDRFTSDEQPGVSRVCLGGIYPSRFLHTYFERVHSNMLRLFKDTGVRDGVLMVSAFLEEGEFYVYDVGFRLQGEAPHLLMKAIHGFDQIEMLIRYALTGSQGDIDISKDDDVLLRGKHAATLWFLVRRGTIARIDGLEDAREHPSVVTILQRLKEGDEVLPEWVGTEKQVLARVYLVSDTKRELSVALKEIMRTVAVTDGNGLDMLLKGFDVDAAIPV